MTRITMTSWIRQKFLIGFSLFTAIGLTSCTNDLLPELYIDTVSIYTESDTNQNSAIAVDLVLVYDQELAKLLSQMSAAKYFSSAKQLLLDNPTLLDIWHWELVPGQIVQDFSPPQEQGDAYAGFVFANYLSPGDHRIKIAPTGIVKVLLLKNDLKNLANYDLNDARLGTTMSDVIRTTSDTGPEDEEEPCKIKLGPTKKLMAPCKKVTRGTKQPPQQEPCVFSTTQPCSAKPVPIFTRPLCPPAAIVSKPKGNKVKKWQN
ncbi:MAG: hypothetical protein JSR85_05000 [Proteobacteria bacterium]|nr:hypothetical protein [Pseudomonadota bacterium]